MRFKFLRSVIGSIILISAMSGCAANSASKAGANTEATRPSAEGPASQASLDHDNVRKEGWTVPKAPDMIKSAVKEQIMKGEDGKEYKVVISSFESENGFELSPDDIGFSPGSFSLLEARDLAEISINKKIFAYRMTIYAKKDAQGRNRTPPVSTFHSILDKDGDGIFETRAYLVTTIPAWALAE